MEYYQSQSCQEEVLLQPDELGDIRARLSAKIVERIGTCSREQGFVMDMTDIHIYPSQNHISRTSGNCFFRVEYTLHYLKPEKGHIYEASVLHVFGEGVFCTAHNMKIFIPKPTPPLQPQDTIRLQIENVRYDNRQYQCIGKWLENLPTPPKSVDQEGTPFQ